MTEWLCWHVGTVGDPKFTAVAKRSGSSRCVVLALWAYLLERAKLGDPQGTFGKFDHEDASIAIDVPEKEIAKVMAAFRDKGMTTEFKICNWSKRQHKPSTERTRKYRENQKQRERLGTVPNGSEHAQHNTAQDRTDNTKNNTNPSISISADDAAAISNRVLDILGVREDPRWFGDGGMVRMWLTGGADPELDIFPTIQSVMRRRNGQGPPQSLKYFTQAISDARDMRLKGLPPAHANGGTGRQAIDYEALQRKLDEEAHARDGTGKTS